MSSTSRWLWLVLLCPATFVDIALTTGGLGLAYPDTIDVPMRDRFSWPPTRPDFAMYVGVGVVIASLIAGAWEVALIGVALVVVGLLLPRMRGNVLIDMGKNFRFRGDLADADEPGPKPPPANHQTAPREQLPPPAPPTSSRSPEERSSSSDH